MKLVLIALAIRFSACIFVMLSFDLWLIYQFADYKNREMNTVSYYSGNLTSYIVIAFYIAMFILASVLLSLRDFIPCSCCCVCTKYACCLNGQNSNALKSNAKFITKNQLLIRTFSIIITTLVGIWFLFAVFGGQIDHIFAVGIIWNFCFVFQFVFKTRTDFKIMGAVMDFKRGENNVTKVVEQKVVESAVVVATE
ncbi:Hypothetical_protein [Hexamita inflata]|uniref:Hypothetical_protein n=1 Tax=Hexamita inflata TaxID=28002 RepID=A0ABP1I8M4_9EUKA